MISIWSNAIRDAFAAPFPAAAADRVKLPAKGAALGIYVPEGPLPMPADFPRLFGAPLLSSLARQGDWVLGELSDAFYSACIDEIRTVLPPVWEDDGRLVQNRLLLLASHSGEGCPVVPAVQRTLLLCLCAADSFGACFRAEQACLGMLHDLPPRDRTDVLCQIGPLADACARLLKNAG